MRYETSGGGAIVADTISPCIDAELPKVVALVNAAYRSTTAPPAWTSEAGIVDGERVTLDGLRSEMAATPHQRIYLLREPPELLACVRLEDGYGIHGEPVCHIGMLAVRPDRQDAGLGRRMLEFAEAEVRRRGARAARMSVVSVRASLIAWYERRGYHRTGETKPFPYDAHSGQLQQRRLEFILLQKRLT